MKARLLLIVMLAACTSGDGDDLPPLADGECDWGHPCGADEFCSYRGFWCSGADEIGSCQPRPTACDTNYQPVCSCGGDTVYGNECEAQADGWDVAAYTCPSPPNMFQCGFTFCAIGDEYCEYVSTLEGDVYTCQPVPAACAGAVDCDCLADEPCGADCYAGEDGFTLSCRTF